MTVPKTSKMVTDRQKRYELVVELVGAQREDLIDALNRRFQDDGVPSSAGDVAAYLDSLLGCLKRRFDDLLLAERNHLNELSDDDARRKRRDTAVSELRDVLFGLRNLLRGAFGALPTQELGFENRFEPHPLPLLRQALRIEQRFRDPAVGAVGPTPEAPNRHSGAGGADQRPRIAIRGSVERIRGPE